MSDIFDSKVSFAEFFGWKNHPFAVDYNLDCPFFSNHEKKVLQIANSLLSNGKNFVVTGVTGSGKSTLVQFLISNLDKNYYLPIFVSYGGLNRSGMQKAIGEALGIDMTSYATPAIIKLQKQLKNMATGQKSKFPVFFIDEANLMEKESFRDICSLLFHPDNRIAAALVLVGDVSLKQKLSMHVMASVKSRIVSIFSTKALSHNESVDFFNARLKSAKAPNDLFDRDAIEIIASSCQGNQRAIINLATILLEEAFFRNEKTVGSHLVVECENMR